MNSPTSLVNLALTVYYSRLTPLLAIGCYRPLDTSKLGQVRDRPITGLRRPLPPERLQYISSVKSANQGAPVCMGNEVHAGEELVTATYVGMTTATGTVPSQLG